MTCVPLIELSVCLMRRLIRPEGSRVGVTSRERAIFWYVILELVDGPPKLVVSVDDGTATREPVEIEDVSPLMHCIFGRETE